MGWRVDDEALDVLEPLEPGSDDPLPGFGRDRRATPGHSAWDEAPTLEVLRPHSPRALRMWLIAAGLGVVSVVHFGAAGYLKGVEGDLRSLEEQWRSVVSIDADREEADRALIETQSQYGSSPGLDQQRELLYDAADARLAKLYDEIAEIDANAGGVERVKGQMLDAIADRRRDFRRERVPLSRVDDVARVTGSLDKILRRWRLGPQEGNEVHLTAARELVERLDAMADERTGLTIGAVARDGLFVIDVDDNKIHSRQLDLSDRATVHPVGDTFVVVDGGVARAYLAGSTGTFPQWTVEAEVGVSAGDNETVWLQHGSLLSRLDENQQTVASVTLPEGARLISTDSPARAIIHVPENGLMVTTRAGELTLASDYNPRRFRGDGSYGTNDIYVAGLDHHGRVLIGRLDDRRQPVYSALRAKVPSFIDLAVLE